MLSEVYLLVNLFFKVIPLFCDGLHSYLVGMKRRTSRCFTCKRDNSYFLRYLKKLVHNAVKSFSCFILDSHGNGCVFMSGNKGTKFIYKERKILP